MTKWRFAVLGLVQVLIIGHIVKWAITGETTTPVEPSEAMEFTKHGVVNLGLILFGLALLSTALLGRWFCGWGCHVLLLQDGCGWVLKKMGLRPKPFRSRVLLLVPLFLGLYMFIWPAVYRLGHWAGRQAGLIEADIAAWQLQMQLTTTEFWQTFPGVAVAVPFLAICGFATVYFLGQKGYCTYACPYGGFFAPLDKLSPLRVRVNDDCQQSGHCTAACSSNVRVHEEVRDFGMVVDPGCMKCMDCISVCPNEALSIGWGKPAVMAGEPKTNKRTPNWDVSLREDLALLGVFVVTFMAIRGVYNVVPFLFASGIAAIATFVFWKMYRLWRDENVNFHRWRLRYKGAMRPAGWTFAGLTAGLALLVTHSGLMSAAVSIGDRAAASMAVQPDDVFSPAPVSFDDDDGRLADRALAMYRIASSWRHGGIGLLGTWQEDLDYRIATVHAQKLDFAAAEQAMRQAIERHGMREEYVRSLRWLLAAQARSDEAIALLQRAAKDHPEYAGVIEDLAVIHQQFGRWDEAERTLRAGLAANPGHTGLTRRLALVLLQIGRVDEGADLMRRAMDAGVQPANGHRAIGLGLAQAGRFEEARRAYERAIEHRPESADLHREIAEICASLGDDEAARAHQRRAEALRDG